MVNVAAYRPPAGAPALARLAAWLLRCLGWRVLLAGPIPERCVAVFYPHTSNWDFPIGLLAKWALLLRVQWLAKDSLFRGPLGPLLRGLGGVPVNRRERSGAIDHLADELARQRHLCIAIAPEGTRARTEHWKSGFYHLARAAGVPLALAFIDYPRREIGIGAFVALTGDIVTDMNAIAAFYAGRTGLHPEQQGPVRLREDAGPDRRARARA